MNWIYRDGNGDLVALYHIRRGIFACVNARIVFLRHFSDYSWYSKNEPRPSLSDEGSKSTPDHSSAVPPSQTCSHRLVGRVARQHKERCRPCLLPRLKSEFSTLLFNSLPTYILVVIIATNFNVITRLSTDPKCTDTGKHQWKEQFHYSNAHLAATFLQTAGIWRWGCSFFLSCWR